MSAQQTEQPMAATAAELPQAMSPLRPEQLTISVEEAAGMLGISRRKLYELIQSRELISVKIGGRRLIRRTDLATFVAELEPV